MATQSTSSFFSINKFVVLEYIYNGGGQLATNDVGFRKILNSYNGEVTAVNDDNSKLITKNVADNAVVQLDDGRYALLDIDGPLFYPNVDTNIVIQSPTIFPILNPTYDKVRVHILSGYNFDGLAGFIISIYCRKGSNKLLRLANLSYTRSDFDLLYFNPRPLVFSEFRYDKYVEFLVPSHYEMLTEQEANPGATNILSYILSSGEKLGIQNTIYCEYKNISSIDNSTGLTYLIPTDATRFVFSNVDMFGQLEATLIRAADGDYFEYYATWGGDIIEDFIYQLNSVAGNKFYVIHEIDVTEQIGQTNVITTSISSTQTSDYGKINKFRPVLEHTDQATSFSIIYTIRLYNAADGKSIFKTSTYTFTDINKFGKSGLKLNVGNNNLPVKIYNKRMDQPSYNILDNLVEITKSKVITTYINNQSITVRSDSDIDKSVAVAIKIDPFDNIFKFDLNVKEDGTDDSIKPLSIDTVSKYMIVFLKNDGTKNYISEYTSDSFNKSNGEIAFNISKNQAEEIRKYTNNQFYVVSKNPNGIETVVFSGTWLA